MIKVNRTPDTAVFNIMLQSIRIDSFTDAVKKAEELISGNSINWDILYAGAELHSIKPQLTKLINRVDHSLVPDEFRRKLNREHQEILIRQMSFVAEFIRLRKILNDAGIMIVPFKGFWLASEFYGNLADRESIDIDLFVNEDDLEKIAALMINEGYLPQAGFLQYSIEKIRKSFHEYNFDRFEGDLRIYHVEFHWRMSTKNYGMDISIDDLSTELRKGKLQDHEIDVFSSSANLLLTVMHHGGRDLFSELKQVLDIGMILKTGNIDWLWIMNEANRFNISRLVLVAVNLASEHTGSEIPAEIVTMVNTEKIRSLTQNRMRFLENSQAAQTGLLKGFSRWMFRMRALTSLRVQFKITRLIIVVLIVTYLVPQGLRKYFPYGELAA